MPEVVESRPLREAVDGVGTLLRACAPLAPLGWLLAAGAGSGHRLAPAVAEGIPPGHLADPVGDDDLPWPGLFRVA